MSKPFTTTIGDGIAEMILDHPPVNALNEALWIRIGEIFEEISVRRDVKVAIITGAGEKAFVAGADISELATLGPMEAKEFALDRE